MVESKGNTNIPTYIVEEIEEYIKLTDKGYCKCMKWENIKSLLKLAIINNRITEEEAKDIEKTYCREK